MCLVARSILCGLTIMIIDNLEEVMCLAPKTGGGGLVLRVRHSSPPQLLVQYRLEWPSQNCGQSIHFFPSRD